MATLEKIPESKEVPYQYPGFGNFARVPASVAGYICDHLGYRVAYVEEMLKGQTEQDVLVEPRQPGVRRYPAVSVIKKSNINFITDYRPRNT